MANTPTKLVVDCLTGERKEIPLSAEEIAEREAMAAAAAEEEAARLAEEQAKAEARLSAEAKLEALGLTAEEIAAILS